MRRTWPLVLGMFVFLAGCHKPFVALGYNHAPPALANTWSWGTVQMSFPQYIPPVKSDVQAELAKRGWHYVDSGGAATVFIVGDVQSAASMTAFYKRIGGGWDADAWNEQGRGAGWAKSWYGEVDSVALGNPGNKLVVDLFDSNSHQLLARGVAQNELARPQKGTEKLMKKTVHRMLKGLPKR